ncbi:MAG: phosphatase PAP2 family protein [Alphaproteobacteria bacterium]|nr:phosphatase PAP2 family protein [Alphaproteobacteria bacterium]
MLHPEAALSPRFAWFMLAASLAVFLFLSVTAPSGAFEAAERSFLLALRNGDDPALLNGPGWLLYFVQNITALGGWPVLTVFSLLLAGALIIHKQWSFLFVLLAVVIGETVITGMLKDFFGRVRPDFLPHLTAASSESFPSGHSASAAAIYLTFGLAIANVLKQRAARRYALGASLVLVFLIGASRVFLGVHYPTDVIAGWCVGAAWASAVWLAAWRLNNNA